MEPARVLVVMGVAGAGKTTVGRELAERLGWVFLDGDDLHPPANVAKLSEGIPLSDEDRWPWLERLATWVEGRLRAGDSAVVACSALKRSYRDRLAPRGGVVFVHLEADREDLRQRLSQRRGHYMRADLLESQLEILEPPGPDEPAISVPTDKGLATAVEDVLRRLSAMPGFTHDG